MAKVLLGVTGGIAAYKACELTRLLVKAGHDVIPLVTRGADRFVRRETFAALARRPAKEDLYPHLARADLLLIAPLTANTMAKLAYGLADDVLTEAALAHRGTVLVAPAMNPRMWSHPATQANASTLRERGVELIGPDEGETAEGELGVGRMAEPQEIFERAQELLQPAMSRDQVPGHGSKGHLRGKQVLVTAGGTREPLDAVRFVGNRSSGRMGIELAREAQRRGADVTLIASNVTVAPPDGIEVVQAPTAADVERATSSHAGADVVLMAAAVSDYRPSKTDEAKRPKSEQTWTIELEPTADVLRGLGETRKNGQVLVGFAAETSGDGIERARKKLADKRVDLVVYNDVARDDVGFDSEDNEVVIVSAQGERRVEKAPKDAIAAAILDEVERLI
ncbi:MAG: bifunctional phosphopantothenoylcysteine decarboxylase/phosphopantothenate--cysteine ligase CoaBC [Actinobacteria bacterium]|jgi:phosphopantothenoylcysteine decarboxylase/phosphopantothenate--cysteine ligase|nr:MAG: bifunctional phosphopantothenoylcysteine decarboxylase/phosphopantothenate--cysteine ligase CoaBC [Actinomycetota bacterium]